MCLKFPSSCRQAVWLVLHTACLLWLETSNTLVQPLLGSYQKKIFWRLLTEVNSKGFYYSKLDSWQSRTLLVMHLSWTRAIQAGFHLIDKILPNSPPGDQVLAVWSAPVLGPASGPATAVVASPGTQTHWALIHQYQLKMTHFWLGCCQPQVYFLNHLFIYLKCLCH